MWKTLLRKEHKFRTKIKGNRWSDRKPGSELYLKRPAHKSNWKCVTVDCSNNKKMETQWGVCVCVRVYSYVSNREFLLMEMRKTQWIIGGWSRSSPIDGGPWASSILKFSRTTHQIYCIYLFYHDYIERLEWQNGNESEA